MSSLLRMRKCCGCWDTATGSVATAIASIAASLTTMVFIILGFVYWDEFSAAVRRSYHDQIELSKDVVDFIITCIYWGNMFSLFVILLYIVLCVLLIIGVRREQYKHMIPWISASSIIIPFFTISFIIQFIFGIIGGGVLAVIIPVIVVLVWCVFWAYGFFCVVSHYRVLKGDIHRPVATLWKR